MLSAFLHGFLLAFGLILPLGPQNMFIFTQGATQPGVLRALPAALAAAMCDTVLILLAVLGVSMVVLAVPLVKTVLAVGGTLFLLYMGWITWITGRAALTEEAEKNLYDGYARTLSLQRQILFAASVSLLNPHAILDTIGVVGTSSLAYAGVNRWVFTLACIGVSWVWFLGLVFAGRLLGSAPAVRRYLPRVSAIVMWISAAYLAYTLLLPH